MSLNTALYSHLVGAYNVAFTANAVTNVITAAGHNRFDGNKLRVTSTDALPGGLVANTDYFVINVAGDTFKLSATPGGAEIDITSVGSGVHSLGTALTDLIGIGLYPGYAPQGSQAPYVVYHSVNAERFPHMRSPSGLARRRIQFNVTAASKILADNIADALRILLDGYDKRTMGTEQLDVRLVELENEIDDLLPPQNSTDDGLFDVTVDYIFTFTESIPVH